MTKTIHPKTSLDRLLQSSKTPVLLFNQQREVIYCSAAMAENLGTEDRALIGQQCNWHSADASGHEQILSAICPPPDAFAGKMLQHVVNVPVRNSASPSSPATTQTQATEADHTSEDADHASAAVRGDELERFRPINMLSIPLRMADSSSGAQQFAVLTLALDHQNQQVQPLHRDSATQLHEQLRKLRKARGENAARAEVLLGTSPAIQRARRQFAAVTSKSCEVVIVGPWHIGRQTLAHAIHHATPETSGRRIIPIKCDLTDAETIQQVLRSLAGSPRGQAATKPRLLLLNADQLPDAAQIELREFIRLPSVNLSVLSTSRTDLMDLANHERFDLSLATFLSTVVIHLPPLVQRREDIPLIAQAMVERHNARGGFQCSGLTESAMNLLFEFHWPRNLSEFDEVIHSAWTTASSAHPQTPWIEETDLPPRIRQADVARRHGPATPEILDLQAVLAETERNLIEQALRRAKGNKSKAAKWLSIPRGKLLRRIEQLGLHDFMSPSPAPAPDQPVFIPVDEPPSQDR